MFLKPPRWNAAPALVAREARSLWKGVAFVAPLWSGAGKGALLNSLGQPLAGANPVAGSALQWRGSPYGPGAGVTGASSVFEQATYAPIITSDGVYTGDFTIVCLANPVAEAVASGAVSQKNGSTTWVHLGFNMNTSLNASSGAFRFNTRSGGVNVSAGVTGGIDGDYHMFGGRRSGSSLEAWIDGAGRSSVSAAPSVIGDASSGFAAGSLWNTSGRTINTATNLVFAAAWNRSLSDAEMRLLARDPFCMFRPEAEWRGVWTPLGGGGDTVLDPGDIAVSLGLKTVNLAQAHTLSASKAVCACGVETPAIAQVHGMSAADAFIAQNIGTPALDPGGVSSPGAPGFRTRSADNTARSKSAVSGSRSKSITE